MADAPNGNGYKALAAALIVGTVGGSAGTYTVAADYNKDICEQRILTAVLQSQVDHLRSLNEDSR